MFDDGATRLSHFRSGVIQRHCAVTSQDWWGDGAAASSWDDAAGGHMPEAWLHILTNRNRGRYLEAFFFWAHFTPPQRVARFCKLFTKSPCNFVNMFPCSVIVPKSGNGPKAESKYLAPDRPCVLRFRPITAASALCLPCADMLHRSRIFQSCPSCVNMFGFLPTAKS